MIRVEALEKRYGPKEVLKGISFEVHRGEVLGFLGPNGAGKTTTMKILTCYLAPTGGTAYVGGHDIAERSLEVRRLLGYLPEDTPIYGDQTALEFLEFVAEIRRLDYDKKRRRIRELSEVCGILDVLGQPISELSKGYRQRVGLAQAMLHDPPILVLDEPTSGLDPNQIVEIRNLVKEIGKEKTVILSTHILPEVQATCGRVIIIADGTLVADGTPQELAARDSDNAYRLLVDAGETPREQVSEKLKTISGVSKINDLDDPGGEESEIGLLVASDGTRDLRRDLFGCVKDNDWILLEMQRQAASLEDVFRRLTHE